MERKPKFEFYVLNSDFNAGKIKMWNIFNNCYVYEKTCQLCGAYFDNILEFDWFVEKLDKTIKYEEWSRCEYEIAVGDLMVDNVEKLEKWDCYTQAHSNIKIIAKHCIDAYREYLIEKDDSDVEEYCECCDEECEVKDCCCEDREHKITSETIKASKTVGELFDNLSDIIGKEINLKDLE